MTKKIARSIFWVAFAASMASLALILGVLYEYYSDKQENQLQSELILAVQGVEDAGMDYLKNLKVLESRLTWVDPEGVVLFDSQTDASAMDNHAQRAEIVQAYKTGSGTSIRYSSTFTEQTLYFAHRITDGSVLRVSENRLSLFALLLTLLQPFLLVLLLCLIFSLVLGKELSKRIVKPLERVNLDRPLENEPYEELSPLLRRIESQRKEIRKQLAALQTARDEFDAITRSMREGLVLLNEKQEIVSINATAERLFDVRGDAVGQSFLTVNRLPEIHEAIRKAQENGRAETNLMQNGRIYQLEMNRVVSDRHTIGSVLIAFDVTEKVQSEQMRSEFTANVSHELKTPLQTIMGSAELLENGVVKPEDVPRFLSGIRRESSRLLTLVNDIIALSRLEDTHELRKEPVDLSEIVAQAAHSLQESARTKNIALNIRATPATLNGAPGPLTEIVYNLCDNAVKYNREGGSVDVIVAQTPNNVTLTVRDTGIGIPAEHQSRIFERFYRVDKSHSRQSGGTGLGLSIVKHAVQLHGGSIDLTSRDGEGTTITVKLPR